MYFAFVLNVEDAVGHLDAIRNGSDGEVGIELPEVRVEILKIYIGKEVAIHHEHGIVVELLDEENATDSTEVVGFADGVDGNAVSWFLKVLFDLFLEVIDGDGDVVHTARNQIIYVVVDDAFVTDFQQWFRCFFGQRSQSFALSACHDHGIDWQSCFEHLQIQDVVDEMIFIQDGNEFHLLFPLFVYMLDIVVVPLLQEIEIAVHNPLQLIVKGAALDECAPYITVGERTDHVLFLIHHEEHQWIGSQIVDLSESVQQCLVL